MSAELVPAENIDPINDGSQYAWGENVGWMNAEPANCSSCGVQVNAASNKDDALSLQCRDHAVERMDASVWDAAARTFPSRQAGA